MSAAKSDLSSIVKTTEAQGKVAEKYRRASDASWGRLSERRRKAESHEQVWRSHYAHYKEAYMDAMLTIAVRWAKTGDLSAPPTEMAALLAKMLREAWGIRREPRFPEPVEELIKDVLHTAIQQVATKSQL